MEFQVGDHVIHKNHGIGKIVQLDEKMLSGRATHCYVVQIQDLTVWVPINDKGESNLRLPTPRSEFENLFAILRAPGETLSNDRFERKNQLIEKMNDGKIESICQVVRDLSLHRSSKKLNEHDTSVLERAQDFLLGELKLALSVSTSEAEQKLTQILSENHQKTIS